MSTIHIAQPSYEERVQRAKSLINHMVDLTLANNQKVQGRVVEVSGTIVSVEINDNGVPIRIATTQQACQPIERAPITLTPGEAANIQHLLATWERWGQTIMNSGNICAFSDIVKESPGCIMEPTHIAKNLKHSLFP